MSALQRVPPARRIRALRVGLGVVVGGLALWLAFRGSDSAVVWRELTAIPMSYAAAAVAAVGATVAVIVLRWRTIIAAGGRAPAWASLTGAVLIGQATNILFPLRAGEFARAYALGRSRSLPFQFVLATIAVERLADIAALGASVVLLSWLTLPSALPRLSTRPLWIAAAGAAGVAALLLVRVLAPAIGDRIRARVARRFSGAGAAFDGLRALGHRHAMLEVAVLTIAIVFFAAATNYILFLGAGLRLPASAALALLVVLQVGTSVASVPGNLGVFHYVTVLVLSAYDVDRAAALAYAWALYLLTTMPRLVLAAAWLAFGASRAPERDA